MFKSNMQQFKKEVEAGIKKEQAKQDKKANNVIAYAYSEILKGSTAVDTGLYKNSHLIEVGRKDTSVIKENARASRITWASKQKNKQGIPIFDFKKDKTIRIYNNVNYGEYLEDGSSKRQDPFLYKRTEIKAKRLL